MFSIDKLGGSLHMVPTSNGRFLKIDRGLITSMTSIQIMEQVCSKIQISNDSFLKIDKNTFDIPG